MACERDEIKESGHGNEAGLDVHIAPAFEFRVSKGHREGNCVRTPLGAWPGSSL